MHFANAGSGLCLLDCVDDAAVAAGSEYDQTLAIDDEVRSDLMFEIIRNKTAGILCRGNPFREASKTVDDPDLLATWNQRRLEPALGDLPGGKSMIGNDGRAFRHHER